jgi:hypothetical protein
LRCLGSGHKWRLAWRATPAFASAFAADIGVIDLHPTSQFFTRIALHHNLRQFVFDLPRRRLGHSKTPAEFDAGNALRTVKTLRSSQIDNSKATLFLSAILLLNTCFAKTFLKLNFVASHRKHLQISNLGESSRLPVSGPRCIIRKTFGNLERDRLRSRN